VINELLRKLANAHGEPETPTPGEMALLHMFYLTGLAFVALILALVYLHHFRPSMGLVTAFAVLLGLSLGLLSWVCTRRNPPAALWYASHLAWLARTFTGVLILAGIAIFILAVAFVSAIFFPQGFAVIYGELVLAPLTALWLVYRLVWGYVGLLRCRRVGYVPPPYS
jgi:uncharacterized membrane protein